MLFDYETLKLIWWLLVGALLIGFAIMDGHDMGVCSLLPFVGKDDEERRVIVNTILYFLQSVFGYPIFIFGSGHARNAFKYLRQPLGTGEAHLISNIFDGKILIAFYQSFYLIHLEPVDPDIKVDPFHTIQVPRQLTWDNTYFIGNTHDTDVITQIGLLLISLPCCDHTYQVVFIMFIFHGGNIFYR